jgi:hypothetical protein
MILAACNITGVIKCGCGNTWYNENSAKNMTI